MEPLSKLLKLSDLLSPKRRTTEFKIHKTQPFPISPDKTSQHVKRRADDFGDKVDQSIRHNTAITELRVIQIAPHRQINVNFPLTIL